MKVIIFSLVLVLGVSCASNKKSYCDLVEDGPAAEQNEETTN